MYQPRALQPLTSFPAYVNNNNNYQGANKQNFFSTARTANDENRMSANNFQPLTTNNNNGVSKEFLDFYTDDLFFAPASPYAMNASPLSTTTPEGHQNDSQSEKSSNICDQENIYADDANLFFDNTLNETLDCDFFNDIFSDLQDDNEFDISAPVVHNTNYSNDYSMGSMTPATTVYTGSNSYQSQASYSNNKSSALPAAYKPAAIESLGDDDLFNDEEEYVLTKPHSRKRRVQSAQAKEKNREREKIRRKSISTLIATCASFIPSHDSYNLKKDVTLHMCADMLKEGKQIKAKLDNQLYEVMDMEKKKRCVEECVALLAGRGLSL